jgi:streptogramin lyase
MKPARPPSRHVGGASFRSSAFSRLLPACSRPLILSGCSAVVARASWRPSCSPTSSGPLSWLPNWEIAAGGSCYPATMRWSAESFAGTGAERSTPQAMVSLRASGTPETPSDALAPSLKRCRSSASTAGVMSLAGPADVLVTAGLKDVLPAPDFRFTDRGSKTLRGVPGEWHLYKVAAVEKPLPGPLEPEVAAARRAAVQAPPLWGRRYVPVAAVIAVVGAIGVGGALLLRHSSPPSPSPSPPSPSPSPASTRPARVLLRLDPESGRVKAFIALGDPQPPPPLNPGGSLFPGPGPRSITTGEGSIWVTNGGSDTVLRVDPISGDARVIPVSGGPVDIAVGQRGVWVVSANGDLTRIDPGTNEATTTDISDGAPIPMGMALDDNDSVYVASIECQCVPPNPRLARVDASSGSVTIIPVPPYATDVGGGVIALDDSLWITASSEVWQLDPGTGKVLKRLAIELSTGELAVDQDGSSIWVTASGTGRQVGWAIEIDARNGGILNRQPVGCCPGAIAVGEGYTWVTNSRDGTIERISEVSGDVAPPIIVGPGVDGIAVGQGGIWVTVDG